MHAVQGEDSAIDLLLAEAREELKSNASQIVALNNIGGGSGSSSSSADSSFRPLLNPVDVTEDRLRALFVPIRTPPLNLNYLILAL